MVKNKTKALSILVIALFILSVRIRFVRPPRQ